MDSKDQIKKVRIQEKNFPGNIPGDIGNKPLEVVNDAGETVALFYNTSFMKQKYQDPLKYIKDYDVFFDSNFVRYWDWDNTKYDEEEEAELKNQLGQYPAFDFESFTNIGFPNKAMIALGRLTYPYHFLSESDCLEQFNGYIWENLDEVAELVFAYKDLSLIAKLSNILLDTEDPYLAKDYFDILIENNYTERMFEQPELFFTNENIDIYIEMANRSKNLELVGFLLDYKKKQFRED
ncbi:MAG TPA: hypothetical protein VII93_14390 [Anaerolineales bacterium]